MNFTRIARAACVQAPKWTRIGSVAATAVKPSSWVNSSFSAASVSSFRLYSTGALKPEVASEALAKCLESEIKHEKETGDSDGMQEILKRTPFKVEHKIGNREVRLHRFMGEEKITINFMIDEHTQDDGMDDVEEGMEEYEEEPSMLVVPFSVVITKPSKPELGAIVFSMTCDNTGIEPQLIWHSNNPEDIEASLPTCYPGPKLSDLDVKLDQSLNGFLTARGVDNSLAEVILDIYTDKEQQEYVNWLSKLEKFVSS